MIRKLVLVAVSAAVLVLTGCGGAQERSAKAPPPAAAAPTQAAVPPVELTVKLLDYAFDPKELVVPLGAEVKLTVVNRGKRSHDLEVAAYGLKTDILDAGAQQTLTFKAEKAGAFEMICGQKGHKDKGMVGTLTVK